MFVDYRKFNDKMVKNVYPIPRIDDNLDALSGAKWFTTFDCNMAYNQVPLEEKDKQKTAFATPMRGLYRFTFGLYKRKTSRASENVYLYQNKRKKVKQTISHELL